MNIEEVGKLISILAGARGLEWVVTYLINRNKAGAINRKNDRDDFLEIVKTWREDNERLRRENESLEKQLNEIRKELYDLRSKVILMESAHSDAPIPMWLKSTDGTILSVNKAYEDAFLKPNGLTSANYIGGNDYSIWPIEVADEYRKNDIHVMTTGHTWKGIETVVIGKEIEKWRIIKYVRYAGNIRLGVAGIAIPEKWLNE